MKRITHETTTEDLMRNPEAYGLPNFQQFCANRDRWMGRDDDQMISLSEGPQVGRKDLHEIKYQIHGRDLPNEESVERALGDYGYKLADIDLDHKNSTLQKQITKVPLGGGKFDVVVNFLP